MSSAGVGAQALQQQPLRQTQSMALGQQVHHAAALLRLRLLLLEVAWHRMVQSRRTQTQICWRLLPAGRHLRVQALSGQVPCSSTTRVGQRAAKPRHPGRPGAGRLLHPLSRWAQHPYFHAVQYQAALCLGSWGTPGVVQAKSRPLIGAMFGMRWVDDARLFVHHIVNNSQSRQVRRCSRRRCTAVR